MSVCTFDSPQLTSMVKGVQPTFGFNDNNYRYFGIQASYLDAKGTPCKYSGKSSFNPIFKTADASYTCTLASSYVSNAYTSSIYCPGIYIPAIPNGIHTLSYGNVAAQCTPPMTTTFTIGDLSPPTTTDTIYVTPTLTMPDSNTQYAATATATYYPFTSTITAKATNTQTITETSTAHVNSCGPSTASSTSLNSPGRSGTSTQPPSSSSTTSSWLGTPSSTVPTTTITLPPVTIPTCPSSDGAKYLSNGKVFQIECGVDRSGGDLAQGSPVYNTNLQGCIDACANTSGCVDISLSGTACYLKGTLTTPEYNANVAGAELVGTYGPSGTTITTTFVSSSAPAPTGAQCPADNSTSIIHQCGSRYKVECGCDRDDSDIPGNPYYVTSLNDCAAQCDATKGCVAMSWTPGNPGPCYLKSAYNACNNNPNVWGASLQSPCDSYKMKRGAMPADRFDDRQNNAIYAGPDTTYVGSTIPHKTTTVTRTTTSTYTPTTSATKTVTITQRGSAQTTYVTTTQYLTTTITSKTSTTITSC